MEIQIIWLIILSIATPVAGVVGFGIQLRNIKKLKLENQKLELEIINIQKHIKESESQIVKVTNDEVLKYSNNILFCKESPIKEIYENSSTKSRYSVQEIIIVVFFIFLLAYFIYDVYRLSIVIWSMF